MAAGQAIRVRPLTSHAEFGIAVGLQREIWGFADVDLLPVRLFVVAADVGGQVFGAFDDGDGPDCGRMVGFLLAIPGFKDGPTPYLHSHMLGVLPSHQDLGVGRTLKLAQKQDAISRSISLIEWTFDPLELKNAAFNLKLGAVMRRFLPNHYGYTSSQLNAGLPTDRLVAEWFVSDPPERSEILERLEVPANLRAQPDAAEEQARIAQRFQDAFACGLAVVGLERGDGVGTYLLGRLS